MASFENVEKWPSIGSISRWDKRIAAARETFYEVDLNRIWLKLPPKEFNMLIGLHSIVYFCFIVKKLNKTKEDTIKKMFFLQISNDIRKSVNLSFT